MAILLNVFEQFCDSNGDPLSGGTLTLYDSGTTTPKATYTDKALTSASANPLTLAADGRAPNRIFSPDKEAYTILLKDSTGATIESRDDVFGYQQRDTKDVCNILDFQGVDPTGNNDSYSYFNTAMASEVDIYVPKGTYLLGTSLAYQLTGQRLFGDGPGQTILKASHTAGPVVQLKYYFNDIERLTIDATSARTAGAVGQNMGILKEAVDSAGQHAKFCRMESLHVVNQPGHGIAWVGSFSAGRLDGFRIEDCKGHGLVLDNGTLTSRTNTARLGGIDVRNGVIEDCTGHAVKMGDNDGSVNYPYRVRIHNVDSFRCALAAGVRKTAHNWWVYGENCRITESAMGGGAADDTPTVGSLYIAGRNMIVENPRFIKTTQPPCNIGNETADSTATRGITIRSLTVSGMAANADPAVVIDSLARNCHVDANQVTTMDQTATPSNDSEWEYDNRAYHGMDHYFKSLQSLAPRTIGDNAVDTIEFSGDAYGKCIVVGNTLGAGWAECIFRVVSGGAAIDEIAKRSSGVALTTGALTGETGTNGNLTISAHTDRKIYIENRTGASHTYAVAFMCMQGSDIVPAELVST